MGLKDLVSNVKGGAASLGDLAGDKLSEWLIDYKKATDTLGTLGFAIGKFAVSMGLPPEVHTTLSGKVASIQKEKVDQLLSEHQGDSTTVMLLKSLLVAKRISDHIEGRLDGVTLHVTLGVLPSVNVELH